MNDRKVKTTLLLGRAYLAMGSLGIFVGLLFVTILCFNELNDAAYLQVIFVALTALCGAIGFSQIYFFIMKAIVSKRGVLKTGLILKRTDIPLAEYSTFLVEFENEKGEVRRTKFTYQTASYTQVDDYSYIGTDLGVDIDAEDYILVFVYKNFAYYNGDKLLKMEREERIRRKREIRLNKTSK